MTSFYDKALKTVSPPTDEPTVTSQPAPKAQELGYYEGMKDLALQGLTFGFSDEIEAGFRSLMGEDYTQVRDELRSGIDQYRKQYPAEAITSELAGGLVTSILPAGLLAKAGGYGAKAVGAAVRNPVKTGAGAGAVYGTGVAEEMSDVPSEAAISGLLGGVLPAVAPKVKPAAQSLIEKGVKLSGGQEFGGLIGLSEKTVSMIEAIGSETGKRSKQFKDTLSRSVFQDVQNALGTSVEKKVKGDTATQEGYRSAKEAFKQEYRKVLNSFSVNELSVRNSISLPEDVSSSYTQDVIEKVKTQYLPLFKKRLMKGDGGKKVDQRFVTGQDFQDLQSFIKQTARNQSDPDVALLIREIDAGMLDNLGRFYPEAQKRLKEVNSAYRKFLPLEEAAFNAGTKGSITPELLDSAVKKFSKDGSKESYILGTAFPETQETVGLVKEVEPKVSEGLAQAGLLLAAAGVSPEIASVGTATGLVPALGGIGASSISPTARQLIRQTARMPAKVSPVAGGLTAQYADLENTPAQGLIVDPIVKSARNFGILGQ